MWEDEIVVKGWLDYYAGWIIMQVDYYAAGFIMQPSQLIILKEIFEF